MKLIILDDSFLVLQRVVSLLSSIKNLEIISASDIKSFSINMLNELRPDILLLDPSSNPSAGVLLIKKIKTNEPEFSLVVYSNIISEAFKNQFVELGIEKIFDKSHEIENLILWLKGKVKETTEKIE